MDWIDPEKCEDYRGIVAIESVIKYFEEPLLHGALTKM